MGRGRKGSLKRAELTAAATRPPLLTYLQGALPSLSPADRLIAERILVDPDQAASSSITALQRQAGASLGSIVSFCQRLGFKGFVDFKAALTRELALSGLPAVEAKPSDPLRDKVFRFHMQSLEETLKVNPQSMFDRVAQALEKAKRIEFFSTGLSYPVAFTAYSKFLLIGLPASAQSDAHLQLIHASKLKKGDVAFGISCSGATRETVQCLEVARARGAITICLTNAMHSPITAHTDLCLYATPSEVKYFQAPMASRVTQLAVMDTLFVTLALKDKARTASRLRESVEELLERRLS